MKRLIICLVIMLWASLNTEATIQGNVVNGPQDGVIKLMAFTDFFSWETQELQSVKLKQGRFHFDHEISITSLYRLALNGRTFDLYLVPNQTYELELRPQELVIIRDSEDRLNERIRTFETFLKETEPQISNSNSLHKISAMRSSLRGEAHGFYKCYSLIKLLQRESLLKSLSYPQTIDQLTAYRKNKIEPLLSNLDLRNPASTALIKEYATSLFSTNESCAQSQGCTLKYQVQMAQMIEDSLLRDLVSIAIIQNASNAKHKRNKSEAESLLDPYIDSDNESVRDIALNVLTLITTK